ncbi:MAG: outer membrane lipoprotein-sorting protein [Edaphobacter sp.]|uniref:LolA family protein n=1 Tax=Edaphobacter sp. TaxID=1934404 RepID=UPI0023A40E2D|nr:outer membrane lipoprotein-sorting protein [Edaphobacter sp.]MDE1175155.1 outer membrane lipoprotein-sorting protein [Edaphobacter sp.]
MKKILIALLLAAAPIVSFAQPKPGELDQVLRQMDTASTKFKSAEADFQWDFYERVVKQTTSEHGSIYFKKNGANLEMGAKVNPPAAKFLSFKDGKLVVFDPNTKDLKVFASGKNRAQYESFLTLGFGGSGSELAKAWTVTYLGTEPLSDGSSTINTAKLDLVSKDANVRNMFTHITIWVDTNRGISLKQQFFTPSEDYRTTIYSNIRYNQPVNTKPFEYKK